MWWMIIMTTTIMMLMVTTTTSIRGDNHNADYNLDIAGDNYFENKIIVLRMSLNKKKFLDIFHINIAEINLILLENIILFRNTLYPNSLISLPSCVNISSYLYIFVYYICMYLLVYSCGCISDYIKLPILGMCLYCIIICACVR